MLVLICVEKQPNKVQGFKEGGMVVLICVYCKEKASQQEGAGKGQWKCRTAGGMSRDGNSSRAKNTKIASRAIIGPSRNHGHALLQAPGVPAFAP